MNKDSDRAASRILVIDDEADFRRVIISFLSKQGFKVVEASDGKTGVGLAGETLPDLIVCDLNMPGMDGYEVLAALRRERRSPTSHSSFSPRNPSQAKCARA